MNRRAVLASTCGAFSSGFVGCLDARVPGGSDDAGDESDTEAETDTGGSTDEADSASDIAIWLHNRSSDGRAGRISVSRDDEHVFETTFETGAGGSRRFDPELRDTGQYELVVDADGGDETSYPFSIDDYDLQMGSNLIVELTDDGVTIMIEE